MQSEAVRTGRRRWVIVAGICVLTLVVLAGVTNLLVTGYVRDSVVKVLRCATGDETISPEVTLGEKPVLIDLASREMDQITISGLSPAVMSSLTSRTLPAGDLSITLKGVGLGDPPSMKSAQAAVQLPWDAVTSLAVSSSPKDLTGASLAEEDGLLSVALPEDVGGRPLRVLVALEPDGTSLKVTPEAVVVGGRRIGIGLVSLLAGDLLKDENNQSRLEPRTVDLELPRGARLAGVEARPEGLGLDLDIDPALVREQGAAGRDCMA